MYLKKIIQKYPERMIFLSAIQNKSNIKEGASNDYFK